MVLKFRVIWPSMLIIRGGVATTPSFGKNVREKCSGELGLSTKDCGHENYEILFPHIHSGKKWGIGEAPCREILVLEGNFWNLEGNCAFLYTKTYKLYLNLEACLPGNLHFFRLCCAYTYFQKNCFILFLNRKYQVCFFFVIFFLKTTISWYKYVMYYNTK